MKKFYMILLFLLGSNVIGADVLLTPGVLPEDSRWSLLSKVDRNEGFFPKAIVETNQDGMIYVYDGALGLTDLKGKKTLGGWQLLKPSMFIDFPEIISEYKSINAEYSHDEYEYSSWMLGLGCYNKNPLRYGDFDSDGSEEVVLFLNNDLVVFSPELKKIVFTMPLDASDWLDEASSTEIGEVVYGKPKHKYLSEFLTQNNTLGPGYRIYGKSYQGDFDNNGKKDILTWHKVYESPTLDSGQTGFIKLRDEYTHYEFDADNGYILQTTAAEVVKTWLVSSQLTWQKGFPSKSECAGQEDQLISEMHDPLLNDPDVLQ